jgi:hypothetical protein
MSIWLIVLIVYLVLGIISTFVCIYKEPILLYAGFGLILIVPLMIIFFPYFLLVIVFFPDNTGRWI